MASPTAQPSGAHADIVKGKSPRNAIIGVGIVAAVVIAAIGFYYQLKQSREAVEEAKLVKKQQQADAVRKVPGTEAQDMDKVIADQVSAAHRAAASEARAATAPTEGATTTRHPQPDLTADRFMAESAQHPSTLGSQTAEQNIYASPIFRPGVKQHDDPSQQQQPATLNGLPTPQQVALAQEAAQQAALNGGYQQAQGAMKGAQGGAQTNQQRDLQFINDAKKQSASGEGFLSAGFVGRSHGCTLSPPARIQVLTMGGINSDRPGTADLVVEQDVYDSLGNGCLMIPKGSTIRAPYSSDIQPGQESILVAATELRLPNGKQVPLYGAQGADPDGTAGFSGDVNTHFLKIYGASFLTAILLGKFDSNGQTSTTSSPFGVTQVGSTAGQVAATTAQSILNRYQNIPPTITDKVGRRFLIKVNRDITLEPYHE
jgi:type IV secretion system protein TrbI